MDMNGNLTLEESWRAGHTEQILITVVFGSVVLTGVVGNVLVITLVFLVRNMRSSVNLCLLSLAFADLIVLVFLPIFPILHLFHLDESFIGKHLCIFLTSIDRGVIVCSVLTFLLTGVERYTVLCYPLKSLGMWTNRRVCLLLVLIWAISVGASVPYGYVTSFEQCGTENDTRMCCVVNKTPVFEQYETILTCVSFFLPVPPLVFLYGKMILTLKTLVPHNHSQCQGSDTARKARSEVVSMLAVLVILFIVCLIPFHAFYIWHTHNESAFMALGDEAIFALVWAFRIMAYVNHIVNPIVYFLMSANFRQAFRLVFCRCCRTEVDQSSLSAVSLSRL